MEKIEKLDAHGEAIKDNLSNWDIVSNVIPTFIGLLIAYAQITVNLIFIGTLNNNKAQDAVGLSNVLINIMGAGIYYGLNGALETLSS